MTTVKKMRFLGLTINSVNLELSLNKTKTQKKVSECQILLNKPQISILEITRWLVDVSNSSSFTSKVELSFPPNTKNVTFIGKPFLFRQNYFEQKLKNQTEMVGTKVCNGVTV